MKRVIPNLEVSDASLAFVFTNDEFYSDCRTFAFHSDGKGPTGRAVNIGKRCFPFALTLGYYDPIIGKDDHIEGGDGTHTVITIKIGAGKSVKATAA